MTDDIVEKVARAINASGNGWLSDAEIRILCNALCSDDYWFIFDVCS